MPYFEVYDFPYHPYGPCKRERLIYRTSSESLANQICEVVNGFEQYDIPYVKKIDHIVDYKFGDNVTDETIREWYRTEKKI